ncbi:hypothetical protein AVEN_140730-1 [Araneus ventricosus]|uniref:Uncharacterized protein n=1 Tax=Araneus ventricosus TaxID=182803 RepID=A0A4Y2UZN6_ARAVE|nr:hypothetical protein AVEN_140730-1 [Araneus ventricosus]
MNPSSNLSTDYRPYSGGRPAWAVADGASDSGRDLEDQYESDLVEHRADVIPEPERTGCWYSFTRVIRTKTKFEIQTKRAPMTSFRSKGSHVTLRANEKRPRSKP